MDQNDNQCISLGIEASKAVQEIAKSTGQGLVIVQKFGTFIGQFIDGSLEQGCGIIEDKLKYLRWERQVRFMDRANHFMAERDSRMRFRPVPLNVAIPIFEAASLEKDDDLQDLWARLLVNAADAESGLEVKRSLASVLQDFSQMEAHLLQAIHDAPPMKGGVPTKGLPSSYTDSGEKDPGLPPEPVQIGLWNLRRLGCIESAGTWDSSAGIRRVVITALGKALINACAASPKRS